MPFTLEEDTADDLLYFARAGELPELREALAAAIQQHPNNEDAQILGAAVNEQGNGLLHYSCANGHLSTVEYLLPLHPLELLLRPNQAGNTPLHWAALNGNIDVVKALTSRIEQAASASDAADTVKRIKADQRARELERRQKAQQSSSSSSSSSSKSAPATGPVPSKADAQAADEDQVRRDDDEEDHRPLWDVRNAAGRGPMSEAQLAEKEAVVQFLLEHSLAGAPPAPTDEQVADGDYEQPAGSPGAQNATGRTAAAATTHADVSQAGAAQDQASVLSNGVEKVSLQ
ncbi:hypothetical protein V8E36_003267 [Tilletia maclaganii]